MTWLYTLPNLAEWRDPDEQRAYRKSQPKAAPESGAGGRPPSQPGTTLRSSPARGKPHAGLGRADLASGLDWCLPGCPRTDLHTKPVGRCAEHVLAESACCRRRAVLICDAGCSRRERDSRHGSESRIASAAGGNCPEMVAAESRPKRETPLHHAGPGTTWQIADPSAAAGRAAGSFHHCAYRDAGIQPCAPAAGLWLCVSAAG